MGRKRPLLPIENVRTRYYLRFQVHDRPGVLARLAGALGEASVSIEQMLQEGGAGSSGLPVDIVMLMHSARELVQLVRDVLAVSYSGITVIGPCTCLPQGKG